MRSAAHNNGNMAGLDRRAAAAAATAATAAGGGGGGGGGGARNQDGCCDNVGSRAQALLDKVPPCTCELSQKVNPVKAGKSIKSRYGAVKTPPTSI